MTRKPFATSIDIDTAERFKAACENRGVKMNIVLESFMEQFSQDEFALRITKNGIRLEIEDK